MRKCIQCGMAMIVVMGVCLAPINASAQDSTVDELKKMVQDLTQRLDEVTKKLEEVEKKQQELPAEAAAAAAAAVPPPAAPAARPKGALDVSWREGIRLESAEAVDGVKPFQLRITGRVQLDGTWQNEDEDLATVAESSNGVDFRRVRLAVGGIIYRDYDFMAEVDFADGTPDMRDVYLGANNIPYIGSARVGNFKEFGSLEELASDNDILFIERALPNVLVPSRNVGVGISNAFFDKRMTGSLGVFRDTSDFGSGFGNENWAVTGRVTGLPYYYAVKNERVDKLQLVHLGAWSSYRENDISDLRFRVRPENRLAERYLDTFDLVGDIDSQVLFGGEVAMIYGPFTAQAEYILDSIDRVDADRMLAQGAYVQAAYILTGEHRTYRNQNGVLDKVIPLKNFQISGDGGGPGAWELALRYSWLDFDDDDVTAGTESNITAGVNWYLNPNIRISVNYIHGWVDRDDEIVIANDPDDPDDDDVFPAIDGNYDALLARFQVTW